MGPQWGDVTKQSEEQNIFTFDINLHGYGYKICAKWHYTTQIQPS